MPRTFKAGVLLLVISDSLLWSRVHQSPVGWHLIAQLRAALRKLKVTDSLNVWTVLLLSDLELPPALKEVLESDWGLGVCRVVPTEEPPLLG